MTLFQQIIYLLNKYLPLFISGVGTTLLLAVTGTVVGLILGMGLALLRNMKILETDSLVVKILKHISRITSTAYIEVFRGTPMMVQAIIIYFGGIMIGIPWSYLGAGLFIISINTTAYMAEIIRSGINSVDKGQIEGSRALGFSYTQTMIHIVFPQALRNSLPTIGQEYIVNIKDSSVLNVITVTELFMVSKIASGETYMFVASYLIIAAIYLTLTLVTSFGIRLLEKALNGKQSEMSSKEFSHA